MVHIGNDWDERLKGEFDKPYYQELRRFLIEEYRHHVVYPDMHNRRLSGDGPRRSRGVEIRHVVPGRQRRPLPSACAETLRLYP